MKIGSVVSVTPNASPRPHKRWGVYKEIRGVIIGARGQCFNVMCQDGIVRGYHPKFLIEAESFPYRSHRTMREVLEDEQKPEPA